MHICFSASGCFIAITLTASIITTLAVSAASIPRSRFQTKEISVTVPLTKHTSSLNIERRASLKSHVALNTAKLLRGLENYERNTGETHPAAVKHRTFHSRAPESRNVAGLDLTYYDAVDIWYGDILIGTPPKPFTVQIDTGSSDLFIPSSAGNAACRSHDHLWNPDSDPSKTTKNLGKPFGLKFGDGATVQGTQYTDNITIAGFTADEQTFGAATVYSNILDKSRFPPDGLLGLAFPSISEYPASPLFQTLVGEGKVSDGVFSFRLAPDGGEMYIGGVKRELYKGDITFVNVKRAGFWYVTIEDIRVNGKVVLENIPSIIDTGANYIFGDSDRLLTFYQADGGKALEDGWYTFPCSNFPDVTFTFGGMPFTIPAEDLKLEEVDDGSPDCFSSIVARESNDVSFWSIGIPFLQRFYTVFNISHVPPQVGFAYLDKV